jgi:hypothetical protein
LDVEVFLERFWVSAGGETASVTCWRLLADVCTDDGD